MKEKTAGEKKRIGRPARVPGEKPTKEKIFDVAVDMFAENGYDRTSVRDIARAVGIAESAVYRHYASKEAILQSIFGYMEAEIFAPLPPAPDTDAHATDSIFRDLLAGLPHYMAANPLILKIAHIMFTEMYHNDQIRDYMQREYIEKGDIALEDIFREQMKAGKIKRCDARALARLFNAYRFAWCFSAFAIDYGKPLDVDTMKEELELQIRLFDDLLEP